ncbi:MAG: histidine phosphatase family protein [Gemmatimonadota bacterium]|nr:MAG: histidine phosphatase family protein [Gemmatimonadota bacterium]
MKLLVVRHAIAEPRHEFELTGQDESLRPLTARGRERMERGVRGIHLLVPELHVIASSPLTRAFQTAETVASAYPGVLPVKVDALAPGGERRSVLSWIQMQKDDANVAIVGHEPDLALLVSWLLSSGEKQFVGFKKGGACLLTWPTHITAGDARLVWLMTAGQLRRIGKKSPKVKGMDP